MDVSALGAGGGEEVNQGKGEMSEVNMTKDSSQEPGCGLSALRGKEVNQGKGEMSEVNMTKDSSQEPGCGCVGPEGERSKPR